jgi:hypothetical protein
MALLRRDFAALLAALPALALQSADPADWTCLMDPDVHLDRAGKCPRCGMTLVLKVPERVEYAMSLSANPRLVQPGKAVQLCLRMFDPAGKPVSRFEIVHEKLIHLFAVSEDLSFFAHVHPVAQPDGSFTLNTTFPQPGLYRLLADYYPAGSVPQLSLDTLYVAGRSHAARLVPSLVLQQSANLTAALRLEPDAPIAGLETRLTYTLDPGEGLEQYLGAWGHMLVVSEDLIDMIHVHPFLVNGNSIQYNVIFPRPGNYKIWSQFQRLGMVNTVAFTAAVSEI